MRKYVLLVFLAANCYQLSASVQYNNRLKQLTAGCQPASAYAELNVNNVRARIHNGGDMWWDLVQAAQYEIPQGSGRVSLFAGALWIGGMDGNNQLRLAAQRYRGYGNDFFPGPLSTDGSAGIDFYECVKYDEIQTLLKKDVVTFVEWFNSPSLFPDYSIPDYFFTYPAHGDPSKGQSYYLAPFYDNNFDGMYNPLDGDYPYYDLNNSLCHSNGYYPSQEQLSGYVSSGSNVYD